MGSARRNVKLVCLDLDGTLTEGVGGPPFPGARKALERIRQEFPVRLVSNTTSRSHADLAAGLMAAGLLDEPRNLVTPVVTARKVLPERGHDSGILIVEPEARDDYGWFREDPRGPAVVVATEAHGYRIGDLQPAFRLLLAGAAFYALQANRYYRKGAELVTDLGPVVAFLGYASGHEAENLGKPSALLFHTLADELGVLPEEMVMVGDDAEFDAAGSERLGLAGVLVRTGKYRPADESRVRPEPLGVLDSVADLPAWLGLG